MKHIANMKTRLSLLVLTLSAMVACNPYGTDGPQAEDLSVDGSANCYIVTHSGNFSFPTVKGNSSEALASVASVELVWETFGTSETPTVGALVSKLAYKDGVITFTASDRKGNALIAAKNKSGEILWNWHIWLTDKPKEQVYLNNAGTLMDRNLGATSATPGDVCSLGLLYQWGRKDPFLSADQINPGDPSLNIKKAASTITWPDPVLSDANVGTIEYTITHPTTFIMSQGSVLDWYYNDENTTEDSRWQDSKTIYDPCPAGWRVPTGGNTGVWVTAFGSDEQWDDESIWDEKNCGVDFAKSEKKLGTDASIWYPTPGLIYADTGVLNAVGTLGGYWSNTPSRRYVDVFGVSYLGYILNSVYSDRAHGNSVRCQKIQ